MTLPFALGRSVASGALWMIGMRLAISVLGVASTIVLARILTPGDFGLVAIATSVIAALEILKTFRLDIVLIQNQSAVRAEYDTAWSLNLAFTMGLSVVVILLAAPTAGFFGEPRLREVMWVLALVSALGAFENIGIVDFRKQLQFAREFSFNVIRKVVAVCVGLWWAFEFGTYWALVCGSAAGVLAGLVASYLMHPFRPRWNVSAAPRMFAFSRWLMLDNAIYFMRHRSVDFLIGKVAGTSALGLFSLSYETGTIANANLAAPIERAVLPGLAKVGDNVASIRAGFLEVAGFISLLVIPVAVGIAAIAPLFVPILLGDRWLDAVPILNVIGLASAVSLLSSCGGSVFVVMGRPGFLALFSGCYVVVLLAWLALLVPGHGALGAAWSFAVAAVVSAPLQLGMILRMLRCTPAAWVSRIWRPVLGAVSMYFIVSFVVAGMGPDDELSAGLIQLGIAVLTGVAAYFSIVGALWWLSGRPPGSETAAVRFVVGSSD